MASCNQKVIKQLHAHRNQMPAPIPESSFRGHVTYLFRQGGEGMLHFALQKYFWPEKKVLTQ